MRFPTLVALLVLAAGTAPAADPVTVVACAPGYPGSTEQAQPSMDAFAAGVARASGWEPDRLRAVYHERLEAGLERLQAPDAALALVPLPFYLEYRERLALEPLLEVVPLGGELERWSLVARRGAVPEPAALAGWHIAGMPGYSTRFVRNVALDGWGPLPQQVDVRFTPRVLSALRAAAKGEPVAVLLDRAQEQALASLPYAAELETLTRSAPMPASLLCRVGDRLDAAAAERLVAALVGLHREEAGRALLAELRVTRFRELRPAALERSARAFQASPARAP